RLDGDAPFVDGVGEKPKGAAFYPADMTTEELEAAIEAAPEKEAALRGLYSMVERRDGELVAVPYSDAFADEFGRGAQLLLQAAELADDAGFKRYLETLAEALLANDYYASDLAWMDMTTNSLDLIYGPIETYEDQLFGYRAGAEAYVLVKDQEWSQRLARYAGLLGDLQRNLPVPEEYRAETPGGGAQLGAYDIVYSAGHGNAGSKSIAVNLPNDERVQLEKGTRRLQIKNAMRAKFDQILVPISELLIAEDQRQHITFDAFFGNTMFHEVAHGLGIKNTINGNGTVRQALKETASALEEGKADVLGLFMITQLEARGELDEGADLRDHYVTFLASIFRSIRFGSSSAHGVANLLRFNEFREAGAFTYDTESGTYRVDFDQMTAAMNALAEKILRFQGDGDLEGVRAFVETQGQIGEALRADLDRVGAAGIPVDILYEQGLETLGL
ncbi:MAG: Zn-dependent hydrolase, partial [Acidobacteriota bacterium]